MTPPVNPGNTPPPPVSRPSGPTTFPVNPGNTPPPPLNQPLPGPVNNNPYQQAIRNVIMGQLR
jgi:hypothetical protein